MLSATSWLLGATILLALLLTVLGSMLAVGWTIARLRIWAAEARFVESNAGPASHGDNRHD